MKPISGCAPGVPRFSLSVEGIDVDTVNKHNDRTAVLADVGDFVHFVVITLYYCPTVRSTFAIQAAEQNSSLVDKGAAAGSGAAYPDDAPLFAASIDRRLYDELVHHLVYDELPQRL